MNNLEELYKNYNFPGKKKLYELAKKNGVKATLKAVDEFLNNQKVAQVFTKKNQRKKPGHIVAFHPDERYQMDLIDMTNFSRSNSGYGWIMLIIDIFTRKLAAFMMKDKSEPSIIKGLEQFFEEHDPDVITTDNESGFKSRETSKLMKEHEVVHQMVDVNDHKPLGIIDRAVKTVKMAIYKYMKYEQTSKYKPELGRIIRAYNSTPNAAIQNIAPDDAALKTNREKLQIENHEKDMINKKYHVEFKVGDVVRVALQRNKFSRAYDETYGDEQHEIVSVTNQTATLDNGARVGVRRLLKVSRLEQAKKPDRLTQARARAKVEKKVQKNNLDIFNSDFQTLPSGRTRQQERQHLGADMKGLSKAERFRWTGIDTAQIVEGKRRGRGRPAE
jgi:hypothetical protein